LLTDPQFAKRMRDLVKHSVSDIGINDVELLKLGRHFRLGDQIKLVVGRNHGENERLVSLALDTDYVIQPLVIPGPVAILRIGDMPDLRRHKKLLMNSVGIVLRYSDVLPGKNCQVKVTNRKSRTNRDLTSMPSAVAEVEKYRI